MSTAAITALITGITALVGAVTALVVAIQHVRNPDAHPSGTASEPPASENSAASQPPWRVPPKA